jgi:hypothetical protein
MTTLTLTSPESLLAVLPYQLGYHPDRSVVVVAMLERRIGPMARIDLVPEDTIDEAVPMILRPLLRLAPTGLFVAGYESEVGESKALVDAVVAAAWSSKLPILEALVVHGDTWRSVLPRDEGELSPAGTIPPPEDVPVVSELVAEGCSPLASRAALASCVAADPVLAAAVAAAAAAGATTASHEAATARRSGLWARLAAAADGDIALAGWMPDEIAHLAQSLRDAEWRDALIAVLGGGSWGEALEDAVRDEIEAVRTALGPDPVRSGVCRVVQSRLFALCRHLPDELPSLAVGACALTAAVAWEHGDGALSREAVDRALRLDPEHRLSILLERMLDLGIPPLSHSRADASSSSRSVR